MGKKRILVIDDEKDMVYALKMQLEASGYEVIAAYDGAEGIEIARTEKPDLILLDIMMPKKDGYTFMIALKKDIAIKSIPVIVLTGKPHMKDMFQLEGVKAYMTKPVEQKTLLDKIKEVLNHG